MELFVVGKDIMRNNTENNEIFLIEVDREKIRDYVVVHN